MSTTTDRPRPRTVVHRESSSDSDVRACIRCVLSGLYPQGNLLERRSQNRYPYPQLVYLTPVAEDGVTPQGETLVVVGKHLSERGLGFYHPQPLAHRRMIASLETSTGSWLGLLIDATWCRFTGHGWYESGGRFLETAPSPVNRTQKHCRVF